MGYQTVTEKDVTKGDFNLGGMYINIHPARRQDGYTCAELRVVCQGYHKLIDWWWYHPDNAGEREYALAHLHRIAEKRGGQVMQGVRSLDLPWSGFITPVP